MSLCDPWGKENWGDKSYLNPGFLSGSTLQKMGTLCVLNITELTGFRLEFESAKMNGICRIGYWRKGLPRSLQGGSIRGEINWICSEGYCVKSNTELWLQAGSSMEEAPEASSVKDTEDSAQRIGETSLGHIRHSPEVSERFTWCEKDYILN